MQLQCPLWKWVRVGQTIHATQTERSTGQGKWEKVERGIILKCVKWDGVRFVRNWIISDGLCEWCCLYALDFNMNIKWSISFQGLYQLTLYWFDTILVMHLHSTFIISFLICPSFCFNCKFIWCRWLQISKVNWGISIYNEFILVPSILDIKCSL